MNEVREINQVEQWYILYMCVFEDHSRKKGVVTDVITCLCPFG